MEMVIDIGVGDPQPRTKITSASRNLPILPGYGVDFFGAQNIFRFF